MVKTSSFCTVLFAAFLAGIPRDAAGKTWFVDGGVAASGTGASWGSPFKTIQEAVDAASGWPDCLIADSIWVKEGTYVLSKEIGIGNIDADPLFFAATYRLVSSSPCIDAGSNSGAPADDLDGDARPVDGNGDGAAVTDMGALEHP